MGKKNLEIRVGGDMWKDVASYVDNPKELDKQPDRVLYVKDFEMLAKMISKKRLELLYSIKGEDCVSALAKKLSRKQEAVSRDLSYLAARGVVKMRREGNKSIAEKIPAKLVVRI